jgi:uncharacterized protein (DUF433 family)
MSTEIASLLVSTSEVCGGRLRIQGTRITVNRIILLYKQGYKAEDITEQYPDLTLAHVHAALAHYYANQEEIEAGLSAEAENQNQTDAVSGSPEKEVRLEAFKKLQRNLQLTPKKAAEWQNLVREARR